MARPSLHLVSLLRKAARRLEESTEYQWGHMGSCNCGFLAQVITDWNRDEIHRRAMQGVGDWTEQLNDYCPSTGLPFDEVIAEMIQAGFDRRELQNLERLSDHEILHVVGKPLRHNVKSDVVLYLKTWASFLEDQIVKNLQIPSWETSEVAR